MGSCTGVELVLEIVQLLEELVLGAAWPSEELQWGVAQPSAGLELGAAQLLELCRELHSCWKQ